MANLMSGRPTVLIVEDDRSLLSALTFALDAENFEVRPYHDGESLLAERQIFAQCLVIDQKLPGLDGLSLVAGLRERNVHAPVILITTNPDPQCERRARAAGDQIVEKPLLDGALRRAIDQAIGATSPEPNT